MVNIWHSYITLVMSLRLLTKLTTHGIKSSLVNAKYEMAFFSSKYTILCPRCSSMIITSLSFIEMLRVGVN